MPRPTPRAGLACALVLASASLTCKSHSPFSRTPAAVALDEPCRYMGTFHKESRERLEALLDCHAISETEWRCMTGALKALDHDFTARCRSESVDLDVILADQTERYTRCLPPADDGKASCAALSDDWTCVDLACGGTP